jgi:hypothetical protein
MQRLNLFDDLDSVRSMYAMLRGSDCWHCNCSELATYRRRADHASLIESEAGFQLKFATAEEGTISLSGSVRRLRDDQGQEYHAFYKAGEWIFEALPAGNYRYA